ncbi:MAG: bifunctional folylpolyglutamate synthase/dihydrofolate synthase [Candidatus Promineifilaceae bacterium]
MTIDNVLSQYKDAYQWLLSLVLDPTGKIETRDRSREGRIAQYQLRYRQMRAFLDFAGNPETNFKSVHVAGTSGKGSVTVMISALLTACGQVTGDHTSPFLQLPTEKLRVDGQMIAPSEFAEVIDGLRTSVEQWKALGNGFRYAHAWAALTFLWFNYAKVDWGVYETGVGGRFASSNLMPAEIAVITNVDYDHVKSLGPTLEGIAWHKIGIIRPNKPIVTTETKPEILAMMREEADKKNATLVECDYEIDDAGALTVRTPHQTFSGIRSNLRGKYQLINAALSITAVDILAHKFGFALTEQAIESALNSLVYAGRFEIVQREPTVILDGAHNPAKMRAFVGSVQQAYPNRKATIMIGKLATKDGAEMFRALLPIAKQFVATEPNVFGKHPTPAAKLAADLNQLAPDIPVTIEPVAVKAVAQTLQTLDPDDLFIITGSIYMVGAAREYWHDSSQILRELEQKKQDG